MSPHTLRRARQVVLLLSLVFAFAAPSWAQFPPCGDGNIDVGEFCDDGPLNGQPGSFCTADCTIRPGGGGDCGNGDIDLLEDCDEGAANGNHGSCCTAQCTFRDVDTPCRTANGVCDLADTCTGASGTCVDDKSTALCRGAAGICDASETCDGVDDDCPANAFQPTTVVCRGAAGVCDLAEHCTGSTAACPANAKSTAVCRPAAGVCDEDEVCNGSGNNCPNDHFASSSTVCRSSAGVCDPEEECTGSDPDCPADAKSTAVCRSAAGVCDFTETCDGVADACPADAKSTAQCRSGPGICDRPELCDGVANTCPTNTFKPAGTLCRPSAGVCDLQEECTGSGPNCPADVKSTAVCRSGAGVCDVDEVCDGSSNNCPANAFEPATTICRTNVGVCDVAENCTGTSASCPADGKSTAVCRAAAGACDVIETCDGVNDGCPADDLVPGGTVCRADAGDCDVAEECTGSDAACPVDAFEPDETSCDDVNVCSINDRCIGGVCGGFLVLCGNGAIDGGCLEECDDGGNEPGDGCDESCRLEPCGPSPLGTCKQLTQPGKASVALRDRTPNVAKNALQWKFAPGEVTSKADFGDPTATTSYQLCIYDQTSGNHHIRSSIHIPAGGTCSNNKPCWKGSKSGFKYSNKAALPHGITKVALKQGLTAGKTRIQIQGRGGNIPLPPLPFDQDSTVTFQIQASNGNCWQASYATPAFRNLTGEFRDK